MEELRSKENLPTLHPILLDVTNAEHITSAVRMVEDSGLPLAGIVNNAGLGYPLPIELADMDRVRDVYEVNVFGVMAMVKAFGPQLRRWKGRVVNVGSVTGTLAAQSDGVYASSKHAVEGLTDALRLELGAWDISVSLIIPGQVRDAFATLCVGMYAEKSRGLAAVVIRWRVACGVRIRGPRAQLGTCSLRSMSCTRASSRR